MNGVFMRLLAYPPIGKLALNMMKKNMLKPFKTSLGDAMEKQEEMLKKKFRKMEGTEIGGKLGIKRGTSLQDLPTTDYAFYEPFFSNPSPSAFMYPLESYERMKTSGTAGKEKWFLVPRAYIKKLILETVIPSVLLATHDGEKVTLEYGDTIYADTAPRPFGLGVMVSVMAEESGRFPLFNIVPNFHLPFEEKVRFFINNYDKIDYAIEQASIVVSKIIPELKKPIKLKGIFCQDTAIAEAHFDEISKFAGVPPRTTYQSTDTLACSVVSLQYPLSFFFDWRRGLYEFVPVKDGRPDESEIVEIDEVEVGKIYELIYTSFETEVTRYDIRDAFRCVGKGDDILRIDYPIFKFHTRLEKTISLHNFTRINEEEILAALRENKIPSIEFTARTDVEKGLEYLVVYVEVEGDLSEHEIQELLHKHLYANDRDYRDLVDFYGYAPLRVVLVPRGVFAEYLMDKVAAVPKVDRIKMRDEEFKKFIQLMKERRAPKK